MRWLSFPAALLCLALAACLPSRVGIVYGQEQEADKENDKEDEEEDPLESDRPDFTEASTTVGRGRLQIESGYTYFHRRLGKLVSDSHTLPEMLVRYGISQPVELRAYWEGMVFDRVTDRVNDTTLGDTGSTDLELGTKIRLSKQQGWQPRSAIILACTAPIGAPAFSSRQVDVNVNYCYSWEITKKLSIACSTGNTWTRETSDHFSYLNQSLSTEYELTKKLHVFSEFYAFFPCGADDRRAQPYYDAGFTYLITPNLQLDWRAGFGLNRAAEGFFTGCGLVKRW